MKKRALSLILVVSFIMSLACFNVSAGDYEGSWAKKEISFLIEKGFVSGDDMGNVNPDATIKRCEFVKVINKISGYTKKAEVNFSDVASDKWYYEEFLIAKENGVINGDNLGNANPESYITREEAFKIIATVLDLKDEAEVSFADEGAISDWALPFIKRVYKAGLVKGYSDGTVKPLNNITRAETFYMLTSVYNMKNTEEKEENEGTETVPSNPVVPPISTGGGSSSSGGSGGGGGGGVIPNVVATPVITAVKGSVVNFTKVNNAAKYIVTVSYENSSFEKEVEASVLSVDVIKEISELCESARGTEEIDISVTVTAKSSTGAMSRPSKAAKITANIDDMLSTADLGLTVDYKTVDTVRGFYVEWTDETVKKIIVKGENADKVYENPVKPLNITADIVTDGFLYKIIATSDNGKEVANTSVAASYFEGGTGTEDDPYLIGEGYQFLNVAKNMSAHYLQIADITVDGEIEPLSVTAGEEFSGTYKTKDGVKRKINATVGYDGKYASLFGKLKNATLDGIIADGSVNSTADYAGGIAGEVKNSEITNCENKMTVVSTGSNVGGVAGYADGTVFNNIINLGNVSGKSGVGGIVGVSASVSITDSSNSASVSAVSDNVGGIVAEVKKKLTDASEISGCVNSGSVSVTGTAVDKQYAGGIIAKLMDVDATFTLNANKGNVTVTKYSAAGVIAHSQGADITKCYNSGTVTGTNYIAGIITYAATNTVTVSDCMNIGNLEGGTTALAAGILASATVAGVEVKNCINIGEVTGKGQYVYPIGDYKNIATLTNNYYLPHSSATYANTYAGTTEISRAGWSVLGANKQLPPEFLSESWEYIDLSSSNKFPLPQIKGNNCPEAAFATVDAGFAGGAGIKTIPFEISTKEQLANIASYPNAYYVLLNDIDGVTAPVSTFSGHFDGNNKKITVNISSTADNIGLFADIKGATIKNLTVDGTVSGKGNVGALIGRGESVTVTGCVNNAVVSGTGRMIGGLIGNIAKTTSAGTVIENCVNNGNVTGGTASRYVGGVIGCNYDVNCEIKLCANHGIIETKEYYPAGIVAFVNNGAKISQCLNTGEIKTANGGSAGIVSQSSAGGVVITDCMNIGNITAGAAVKIVLSGILALGHINDKVSTSFNKGLISGHASYAYPVGKTGTYTNNVYLKPETAFSTASTGAEEIDKSQWEAMTKADTLPTGFSESIWEYAEKTDYNDYPLLQLKNNPFFQQGDLN